MNMIAAVDEFQSYCMRPEQLLRASSETEGQLAQKLEELGMLYEAYLAVCANGNADPTERILWLSEALQENDWARNQTFYLDGFTDFTGAELSVLEVLLRQSHDVWVAVSSPESKTAASRPSDETKRRLKSLASQWGVGVEETVIPEWESRSAGVKGCFPVCFLLCINSIRKAILYSCVMPALLRRSVNAPFCRSNGGWQLGQDAGILQFPAQIRWCMSRPFVL